MTSEDINKLGENLGRPSDDPGEWYACMQGAYYGQEKGKLIANEILSSERKEKKKSKFEATFVATGSFASAF